MVSRCGEYCMVNTMLKRSNTSLIQFSIILDELLMDSRPSLYASRNCQLFKEICLSKSEELHSIKLILEEN